MSAWRAIPSFPGYEMNTSGRVRKADTGYEIARSGRRRVQLYRDGRVFYQAVDVLVAEVFPATPAPEPEVLEVEPLAQPDSEEVVRLRAIVAELEAELAVYRGSVL
ncbi:MAG: hypothetical protein AB7E47_02930 [Desulfovibrionaceae bacterium]